MHTSQYIDEHGVTWYAHHNGDYSGNVTVELPEDESVEIPFDLMQELVGGWLQSKFIEEIEGLDGIEFLNTIGR